jgi:hypothetical protein
VQLEPGMFGEPGHHVFVFVGGVVVQNHMNRKAFGYFLVDREQKLQELLVAVLVHARFDDGAINCVQRRVERALVSPLRWCTG